MPEQPAQHPPLTARRIGVGVALTAIGGYVDCFSYLTLSRVYTAQMSGNTVLVAVHAGRGEASSALLHAYTIGIFLFGLLAASLGIELGQRRGMRRIVASALGIEAVILAAVAIWGAPVILSGGLGTADMPNGQLYALIAMTAVAMGIQNTMLRMAGILAVFTTHVTGTLTRLTEQFAEYLLPRLPQRRHRALREAAFSAAIWLAFFLGALAASELLPRWGPATVLMPPIALLLAVAAFDLLSPFAEP